MSQSLAFWELPAEHTRALQAMDVHLYGIRHGQYGADRQIGLYAVGARDKDYDVADACITNLGQREVGVLAIEAYGYDQDMCIPNTRLFKPALYDWVPLLSPRTTEDLEIRRSLHKDIVTTYAALAGILQGNEVHCADMSQTDLEDWRQMVHELRLPERIFLPASVERRYRENRMTQRLGEIGCHIINQSLTPPKGQCPLLAMVVGATHVGPISRQLAANNIPSTITTSFVSPRSVALESIAHGLAAEFAPLIGKSQHEVLRKRRRELFSNG
jgi:hypothetical protein